MSDDIKAIQQALKDKGFDPGDIDGAWGRLTIAALRKFQQDKGLGVDGVAGPATMVALLGSGAPAAGAPIVWYEEAKRLLGLHEKSGPGSNRKVLDLAQGLNIDYPSDDIPWCGLFVGHCIGSTLPAEALPRNPLLARGWQSFGRSVTPRLGAVMVFWRGSKDGIQGHVAFYAGEDAQAYHVLGGNQSDSVSFTRVAKNRLLDARWPVSAAAIESKPVELAADGSALSSNEA